jgi:hypothetical protein
MNTTLFDVFDYACLRDREAPPQEGLTKRNQQNRFE